MRKFHPALAIATWLLGSLVALAADDATSKTLAAQGKMRLKFQAYDGDPKKPETMTFQVNTIDIRQPSKFLKIGDTISKTNFKLTKFDFKEDKTSLEPGDISELTIENTVTHEKFVLVVGMIVVVH
jgi:hypothetical protein